MNEKMTKCGTCGGAVSKKAKKCPHCGEKLRSGCLITILKVVLGTFAFLFALAIVLVELFPEDGANSPNKGSSLNDSSGQSRELFDATIGQPIMAGKWEFTVDSVETRTEIGKPYKALPPSEGAVFVTVRWRAKNKTGKQQTIYGMPKLLLFDTDEVKYSAHDSGTKKYRDEVGYRRYGPSDVSPEIEFKDASVFEVSQSLFSQKQWGLALSTDTDRLVEIPASVTSSTPTGAKGSSPMNKRYPEYAMLTLQEAEWAESQLEMLLLLPTGDGEAAPDKATLSQMRTGLALNAIGTFR